MSQTTPGEGLRLLSLDGGGIRGLSSLQVLKHFLCEIQNAEKLDNIPLPCEYFDLIGGTSTGGIIALMLGRLRMSVDDALRKYAELSKDVFSEKKLLGDGRFKATNLERAIKKVIAEQAASSKDAEARMKDDGSCGGVCKTFVCATVPNALATPKPILFRTYHPSHGWLNDCKIWEAARATSAAPIFFKPIEIDTGSGVYTRYTDGGLGNNNPTDLVLQEAHDIFPERKIACLISIGTGRPKNPNLIRPSILGRNLPRFDVAIAVGEMITDCEKTAEAMERRFSRFPNIYFRFNVEHGMDEIKLGDWERLDEVHDITNAYLTSERVSRAMQSAASVIRARNGVVPIVQASGALAELETRSRPIVTRKPCPPPTRFFTGRDSIIQDMHNYFAEQSKLSRIFVLYGLGGSGKSEISRQFVACAQENEPKRFSEIFYVDASSAETIATDLSSIAVEKNVGKSAADATHWMEGQREWLLILDGADDPNLDLGGFIPRTSHGNTIITSRNAQMSNHALRSKSYREIVSMDPDEAKELFLLRAGLPGIDIEDQPHTLANHQDNISRTIVKVRKANPSVDGPVTASALIDRKQELGYFALAIVQAAAYIASNPICSTEQYLSMYRKQRRELLEEYRDDVQKLDSYDGTVYTTWNISFEHLLRQNPLAATFLRVCAFLHHESIPESIFRDAFDELLVFKYSIPPSEAVMSWTTSFLRSFTGTTMDSTGNEWNNMVFNKTVRDLCSYSLMSVSSGSDLSVHLLVQDWTRSYHDNPVVPTYTSFLLGLAISQSYRQSGSKNYSHNLRRLLPHVQEVYCHDRNMELHTADWFGGACIDGGDYRYAEKLEVTVLEASKRVLGEEHPETLTSMGNLASTYRDQGRWTDAEMLDVTVLEAKKRVLGEEHPSTLISMGNLASTYRHQGRWTDAEKLEVTVLEVKKRVLGEEHPETLISMADLATTYSQQGRWKDAEKLEVTVLEVEKRVLGEEHPSTLISMANLATTYRHQGRWTDAEKLEVTALEASKRVLGEEHPDTLTSMGNLASTYRHQGRWTDAEKLEVTVLEAMKRVLGEEHPSTLISMANLAATYRHQGRWTDAEKLEVTALEASKRVLGEEHPDTLTSMGNLASTYRHQGRWTDAEKLEVTALEASKRVLGDEHPSTLTSMGNLASTYHHQGRWTDAEKLEVPVLEASKRVLGEEHPDTLMSMGNLASTYERMGRSSEARRLREEVQEIKGRLAVRREREVQTGNSGSNIG